MKKTITFILFIGIISSCNYHREKLCNEVTLDDYSVDIKFSSFFNCGVFERIVLASQNGDLTYNEKFKLDKLYKIHSKNNCEKAQTDTLVISLSKIQCDSIFDLANNYVNNTQFNIHVTACGPIETGMVYDGGSVDVNLCFENQCKSASYYNYKHLESVSSDLNLLMKYIDGIK